MRRFTLRRTVGVAGLAAVVTVAGLVTPADATLLSGSTSFKMISGLSRVRNCKIVDLASSAASNWKIDTNGSMAVAFDGLNKQACLSLYTPGKSVANVVLSYQRDDGSQIATKTFTCNDTNLVLPQHCPFPGSLDFANNQLRKVKLTFTQTSPAAPPSSTTIAPPPSIVESDNFKMLSGLSRIRNCKIGDAESQASATWVYHSNGVNSIVMSGADHVCMTMYRPGNSTATAVVKYKNAAGQLLLQKSFTCVDTNAVRSFDCPFSAAMNQTLSGLTQVTIDFTQTSPAAGTSSTTLLLGD